MKLVAMLRVKNQILTIRECITKLSELVDEIVIVDNGSTDGTLNEYKKFTKIVDVQKTKGYHEGRDKILALNMAKKRKPDWILWTDADEIFEKSANRKLFDSYMKTPGLNQVNFRMFNFWLSKSHYRVDGVWGYYTSQPQRHMWRNLKTAYFKNLKLHNGGIKGISGKHKLSSIRLKHYGYIKKHQIDSKYKTYNSLKNDPLSQKTLPVDTKTLKLYKWHESDNNLINTIYQQVDHKYWIAYSMVDALKK